MNQINHDDLYSILLFLDSKDLVNISLTNKFTNDIVRNSKKIILRNHLIKLWGVNIYKLIPAEKADMFTNYNMKTFILILELFYKQILTGKINSNSHLLIEIYDNTYMFANKNSYNREYLFNHRTNYIQKLLNKKVEKDNKKINFIINATSYLNRFCYFFNTRSISISTEKIINIINKEVQEEDINLI